MTQERPQSTAPGVQGDRPLRDGSTLLCPRCERRLPEWQFKALLSNPKYASQTAQVVKCPCCSFVFAPLPAR